MGYVFTVVICYGCPPRVKLFVNYYLRPSSIYLNTAMNREIQTKVLPWVHDWEEQPSSIHQIKSVPAILWSAARYPQCIAMFRVCQHQCVRLIINNALPWNASMLISIDASRWLETMQCADRHQCLIASRWSASTPVPSFSLDQWTNRWILPFWQFCCCCCCCCSFFDSPFLSIHPGSSLGPPHHLICKRNQAQPITKGSLGLGKARTDNPMQDGQI